MDKQINRIVASFCLFALSAMGFPAPCQQAASPFDLIPRLPQSNSPDSAITVSVSSNPFDINRLNISVAPTPNKNYRPQFQVDRQKKPLSAKEKTALYQRFLFISVMVMLVLLTLVVTIFRIFLGKIFKAFENDNILSQMMREQGGGITVAYLILYAMFFINAGIFAFIALKHFDIKLPAVSNVGGLFLCIGGIAAFYVVKHILLGIMRFVFPIEKEASRYDFTVMIFNIVVGIFLVPMILLAAYSPAPVNGISIKATIALLLGAIVFRGLRGLFIANRFFAWHKFHFLLYLCAVELAPLLVTFKALGLY